MNWFNKFKKWCFDKTKNDLFVSDESNLYSLNSYQLQNLLDKNIQFHFFQIEDFFLKEDKKKLLKKVQKIKEEELILSLKDQDLKQPLVLICKKGKRSKKLSQVLRDKGFINVYFIEKGWEGLLKNDI